MASLKKRGQVYYIVFSRRVDGKLEQRVLSLNVKRKDSAEKLKADLEERYAMGEINPFGGWSPKDDVEMRRRGAQGTTLAEVGERFMATRIHVKPSTRSEYAHKLKLLKDQLGPTMPVKLITAEDVRAYSFKPGFANATSRSYLRFCRLFFKWMADEEIIDHDVARRVPYPKKVENVSQKVLSESDLDLVFAAFKRDQRPRVKEGKKRGVYVWFKPVVALGFYGGLRLAEIARLRWEEVDFERDFLLLRNTKNGQERLTPIQQALRPYLEAWHRCCGRPRRGLVFCKSRNRHVEVPLALDHISKTFKRFVRAAGLPDGIHFHGLRHSCVTELLRAGFNESEVARWVGHQSTAMTNRYTHLNHNDLQRKLQQLDL